MSRWEPHDHDEHSNDRCLDMVTVELYILYFREHRQSHCQSYQGDFVKGKTVQSITKDGETVVVVIVGVSLPSFEYNILSSLDSQCASGQRVSVNDVSDKDVCGCFCVLRRRNGYTTMKHWFGSSLMHLLRWQVSFFLCFFRCHSYRRCRGVDV